jgi:hypothetical protein
MGRKREPRQAPEPSIAVLDEVCDVEETERPFGKRWHQEEVILSPEHVAALQTGKVLAVDVGEEYVVFLRLNVGANSKEKGRGE